MSQKLNWGILATGAIAKCFARNAALSQSANLVAVASRDQAKADKFGDEFNIPKRYGNYEALLADPNVQAVYIAPPHPNHVEWAIKAAEAKKHLLVEKPLGVNYYEAMAIVEAATLNDVFLMEAFMYRCHPQTAKLVELLRGRAIGDVRLIQASFGFHAGFNADSRTFKNGHAGGGILDVGCYPVSISRLIAGAATGNDFADPIEVKGTGHLGQTGVDEWAVASLKFPGNILAQVATGVSLNLENVVRIFGSEGKIFIPIPWVANRTGPDNGKIIVHRNGEKEPREIIIEANQTSYTFEADVFGRAVLEGKRQAASPAMSWCDTLGNMRTLDKWRESIGLTYDFEKPQNARSVTFANRKLAVKPGHNMKYGRITGLDKPVSRLILGVDNQNVLPHAEVMFDDWIERGGNTFDTGWVYGPNRSTILGTWIAGRGVRNHINVIVKGAHTPWCDPVSLTRQLKESLELMKLDCADIYMMHRDNPAIPAGEFIDVLNEHHKAGRIKVFGGSNWPVARVEEANSYAKKHGLIGFSVVSNNFSLARMVDAPWGGCVSASDPESRAWFTRTQIPLLSWSSQARGFFVPGRSAPDKKDDKELVRCWYSDDNFQRQARANELAKKKGVLPINIAAAYVLHQPFPTFALIGPQQLSETRSSLQALDVTLTPDEVKWLNLEK